MSERTELEADLSRTSIPLHTGIATTVCIGIGWFLSLPFALQGFTSATGGGNQSYGCGKRLPAVRNAGDASTAGDRP